MRSRPTPKTGGGSFPAVAVTWSGIFYQTKGQRIKSDGEGRANFEMAQAKRFILREERNFVEIVDGTFEIPAALNARDGKE
jgi:hypothetical protein